MVSTMTQAKRPRQRHPAEIRRQIDAKAIELSALVEDYEDGDRQCEKLRGAIRAQKRTLAALVNELDAVGVSA